jgi:uncharacterized protein YjaZ
LEWTKEKVLPNLSKYNERNQSINGQKLIEQFYEVKEKMYQLTGYKSKGVWYIIFGPAWTDLGGFNDGTMLIDLSHENNISNENILKMFPHEINHQTYGTINLFKENTVVARSISEGFAVYLNKIYWKDKYSDAQNLGYTEAEYDYCKMHIEDIKRLFKEKVNETNKDIVDSFVNRSYHFSKELPSAIGYFIGFTIIENYVSKYGEGSWKDVYKLSPKQVYELSQF